METNSRYVCAQGGGDRIRPECGGALAIEEALPELAALAALNRCGTKPLPEHRDVSPISTGFAIVSK